MVQDESNDFETSIDIRNNEQRYHPELREFIIALAKCFPDGLQLIDSIKMVNSDPTALEVWFKQDKENTFGNVHGRFLHDKGYAMVGFASHYTDGNDIDNVSFRAIDSSSDLSRLSKDDSVYNDDWTNIVRRQGIGVDDE